MFLELQKELFLQSGNFAVRFLQITEEGTLVTKPIAKLEDPEHTEMLCIKK